MIMKSRSVKMLAITGIVVMALSVITTSGSFAASGNRKPTATNVQYITENGKKTGIKSFTISPYTYYNLSQDEVINPDSEPTFKLDDAQLLKIAKRQIFPKWGVIAEGIFRDQADQLVTIEGDGMMSSDTSSKTSFDRHFSTGKVSNGYNYDWSLSDLASELARESSYQKGKTCWDETRVTGPTQIASLNDARTLTGQELRNCSDDNDVSKDDFLGNNHQKNEDKRRLPDLEDTTERSGFANIVTCVNRAGSSGDYDYVTFGLAVYDFDISPVAAQDLKYIEEADGDFDVDDGQGGTVSKSGQDILMGLAGNRVNKSGISFVNDDEDGTTSYLRNNTTQDVTQSAGLENSITEESSISTDDTYEWGMEQEVGLELNFGGFGPGSIVEGAAAPCMFPRATISMSNSWHELWSTTKSQSESKSASKTKTTNTEVTLPGHTIAVVKQSLNNKKTTENYQQPVILNYKVAIFAMSGDYFNGASGGIENSRYDKQWMSVIFDGSDDASVSGCNALGSLYNRSVTNAGTSGYDGAKGKYRSWCDKSAWNASSKINWSSISSTLSGDNRASHRIELGSGGKAATVKDLATELPLMEKAQMLTSRRESVTSSVEQIVALYPLDTVSMDSGSKHYELVPRGQQDQLIGDKVYLDQIKLQGYDKDGADFYEFDQAWGEWKLLDEDGNVIEDGSDKDEDSEEGRVKSGLVTLITDEDLDSQWIQTGRSEQGDPEETHRLKWKIKKSDDAVILSNETLNTDEPNMSDDAKEAVQTPTIEVDIKDRERDVSNFEIEGTYKGPWDKEINLGHYISADPIDESGRISNSPVYWESKGTAGLEVSEDGKAVFSRKGTYKVRPYSYNVDDKKIIPRDASGDPVWIDVTAQEKTELTSIVVSKPELDSDDSTLTRGTRALGFDLASYTKFFDQYGDNWIGGEDDETLPTVRYSVAPGDYADIDDENILTVTRAGTYTVSAKAYDEDGNDLGITIKPMKISVSEEDWLDAITFDEPAMSKSDLTLKDKNDYVVVENLKGLLTYLDQNEDEWTGKKPNVTFSVESPGKDAEIKGGNFYAYTPGTYTIEASASGYSIDPIRIAVTEDPSLVMQSEDPGRQYLYTADDSVELELERFINATTKFGGKWAGSVPALDFTDITSYDAAPTAEIEMRTVYDGEDDYVGEDRHFFKTSMTGEYVVHVEPKKASEYSEPIDDIHIRVVNGKKIARIEFKDPEDELDIDDLVVNNISKTYPKIDLSKLLKYYDGFGKEIDPENDHVRIPDCMYELVDKEEYDEDSCNITNNVLTPYKGDNYFIKAAMNVTNYDTYGDETDEDTILTAVGSIYVLDAEWIHDYGDWETETEPTCEEDGIRVKRCRGGARCLYGDGCEEAVYDVIPATGHAWFDHYLLTQDSPIRLYTECEYCGEINYDSITPFGGRPIGYINLHGKDYPLTNMNYPSCYGSGLYHNTSYDIFEVPAVGHKWSKEFTVVKEPTCSETGLEAIKCTRPGCNAIREGDEYIRVIPETEHKPDDTAWEYEVDSEGNEIRETCEEIGWQVTRCKNEGCDEPQYRVVSPKGHAFGDPEYEWADDNSKVTATRVCGNDASHVETEEALVTAEVTKEATCTERGETTYTSAGFGNIAFAAQSKKLDDIEPLGHELTAYPVELPTYEEPGHEAYWQCERCGKFYSDEAGLTEISEPKVLPNEMIIAKTDLTNAEKALAEAEKAKAAADKSKEAAEKAAETPGAAAVTTANKALEDAKTAEEKAKAAKAAFDKALASAASAAEKAEGETEKAEAEEILAKAETKGKTADALKTSTAKAVADAKTNVNTVKSADTKAKKVKTVTVNVKTVSVKAIDKAVKKAKGSQNYVTKFILGKKVKKISKKAFSKYKKAKTLVVKTKKLKKKSVKGSLKASKIKTIQVKVGSKKMNKEYLKAYKKIFTKKVAGGTVTKYL